MDAKPKTYTHPPELSIDETKTYTALLETGKGKMEFQLCVRDAPLTVNNFIFLAKEGFYNDTIFHRVIPGFMAQCGDPTGTGRGGPGYRFRDEISKRTHVTGALSMANAGPNTNGSQFFICFGPQPHLNGKHSVFGQLTQGTDILKSIVQGDRLIKVTITEQ
jgi:peptidyl-prolyl cis-trans isomerase B (cyclophilin B)